MLASRLGHRVARMAAQLLLAGLYACSAGSQQSEEVLETQQEDSGNPATVEGEGNAAEAGANANVEANQNYSLNKENAALEGNAEGSDFAANSNENASKIDGDGFVVDAENAQSNALAAEAEIYQQEMAENTANADASPAAAPALQAGKAKTNEELAAESTNASTASSSNKVASADETKAQKNVEGSKQTDSKSVAVAPDTNPKQMEPVSQVSGKTSAPASAAQHETKSHGNDHLNDNKKVSPEKASTTAEAPSKSKGQTKIASQGNKKTMNLAGKDDGRDKSQLSANGEDFVYTVKKGDTLSQISQEVYGRSANWKKIAEFNTLSNAELIFPGQKLSIPKLDAKLAKTSVTKTKKPKATVAKKVDEKQAADQTGATEKPDTTEEQPTDTGNGQKSASQSTEAASPARPDVPGVVWEKPGDYSSVRPDGFATITVKPGFSITKIAEVMFGDPQQWKKVMEFNNLDPSESNRLFVGQRINFTVPVSSSQLPMAH